MVSGEQVTISVEISSGGDEMQIPKVENMEARTAMELLQTRMGLSVSQQREPSEDITVGYAIRTDLPEGTGVKKGDRVTLVISSGPEVKPVELIEFTGQKLENVRKQMQEMELVVGKVEDDPTDAYEPGVVTWQNIPAGTTVMVGQVVDLRVSVALDQASASPSADPTHAVTEPPATAEPTAEPTQPPATQEPVKPVNNRAIFVHLPSDVQGKSSVQVRIEVDGVGVYSQDVETALFPISPLVPGQGTQQVSVYVDGALTDQYMETFS